MDFSWSSEDITLRDSAFAFGKKLSTSGLQVDSPEDRALHFRACWRACGGHGLTGLCAPVTCGGLGLNAQRSALVMEGFSAGSTDAGFAFSLCAHLFACLMPVVEFGSDDQVQKFGSPLASGEWIGANAITESDAGSDVFALKTQAKAVTGGYVLDGTKSYVTNAPVADAFIAYAVTNPAWGYMGITAFLLEKDRKGLQVGKPTRKMGLDSSPSAALYLEDCFVDSANVIGVPGQGAAIFQRSMLWERMCLFSLYLGTMSTQLERCIDYTKDRKQFGRPIGTNQAISHKIVDMKLRLEASRLMLYKACWEFDRGQDASLDIALAKLIVSDSAIQSGLDAIHIHGSVGYERGGGIESMLRDAVPSTIFSGTTEMQKDIAARTLGL